MSPEEKRKEIMKMPFFEWMASDNWMELGVCWPELAVPDAWLDVVMAVGVLAPETVKAVQVKEKFGGLRIYTSETESVDDDNGYFEKVIEYAEAAICRLK